MEGITSVFAAKATPAEVQGLLFREVDFSGDDEADADVFNSGLGELFGLNFVEEDYFLRLWSPKPTNPTDFFALPQPDIGLYELEKEVLIARCKKLKIAELDNIFIAGDTSAEDLVPGQMREIGKGDSYVAYLGMFHHGRIFGESAKERKLLRDGWLPG
ncbi:MAG: hypothetical protein H0W78_05530 [Planctomycetes bacterium]|nr:hypothetical protein [Planctomycetota bacterium]